MKSFELTFKWLFSSTPPSYSQCALNYNAMHLFQWNNIKYLKRTTNIKLLFVQQIGADYFLRRIQDRISKEL